MKKLFVDMDDVLTDFLPYYTSIGDSLGICLRHGNPDVNPNLFEDVVVNHNIFERLPVKSGAKDLVEKIEDFRSCKNFNVFFLTSVNTFDPLLMRLVSEQKKVWIKENLSVDWTPIFVPKSDFKSLYAESGSFIIDDIKTTVDSFISQGGEGFVYKHFDDKLIKSLSLFLMM